MRNSNCRLSLLVIGVVTVITSDATSSVSPLEHCKKYHHDICACHQDKACAFPRGKGFCFDIEKACGSLRFEETDCRLNGNLYSRNGVICKYHGDDGGICDAEKIPFFVHKATRNFEVDTSSNEIGPVNRDDSEAVFKEDVGRVSSFEHPCLVYQIPVKKPGKFQIILEKVTQNFLFNSLDILLNGFVVTHDINGDRFTKGQQIRINYGIKFDKIGQAVMLMNGKPLIQNIGDFVEVKICEGYCSLDMGQSLYDSDSFFLRLVGVMQFKTNHRSTKEKSIKRDQRSLLDDLDLPVGVDTLDDRKGLHIATFTTKKPTEDTEAPTK